MTSYEYMPSLESSYRFQIETTTRIGEVALSVSDLKRSEDFYVRSLGFRVAAEADGQMVLTASGDQRLGGPLLRLYERAGALPRPPRTLGLYHFAILLPSRVALAKSLKRLAETKVRLTGASDHLVSEALYLYDPDGNGIEIYRDRPAGGWTWNDGEVKMDSLPLDFGNLLDELDADPEPWSGLPWNTTIGHIHLHVPDLRVATRFYVDTLGFSIVSRSSGALFLSSGLYHHHIAVNTWAGRNVAPPNAAGLAYFEVIFPTAVGLATASERLIDNGYTLDEEWDGILATDPFGNRVALASAN